MLAIAPVTDPVIDVWQRCHIEMGLKRTTVYLDENDLRDLKIAAARRGVSEAEIIREGVRHAPLRNRVWDEPVNLDFRTIRPLTEDKAFRILPDDL